MVDVKKKIIFFVYERLKNSECWNICVFKLRVEIISIGYGYVFEMEGIGWLFYLIFKVIWWNLDF